MIINKITIGFVTQQYDNEQGRFISQEFVAGDEVEYECEGEPVRLVGKNYGEFTGLDDYLAFDMVQPKVDVQPDNKPFDVSGLKEQLQENVLAVLDGAFNSLCNDKIIVAIVENAVVGQVREVIRETVDAAKDC